MDDRSCQSVSVLLHAWRQGDDAAFESLVPLVYDELRRLARAQMRREPLNHTLQPTALVHEAYARLVEADLDWQDRTHFMSIAAGVMRRVLIDHARRKRAAKRAGDQVRVPLTDLPGAEQAAVADVLALDEALRRLAKHDERQARIVELHYFGGLTYPEICEIVGVSQATVERDMRHARVWLQRELSP